MNLEILEKTSAGLYWMAYLLTGNEDRSVEAFSAALDASDQSPGFEEFMSEWSRKLVIVKALGAIEPALQESIHRLAVSPHMKERKMPPLSTIVREDISKKDFEEAVVAIDSFPRCAMLLTIFEGLTIKAAAILLDADDALTAAAQRIGILQLTQNLTGPLRASAQVLSPA
jgi:hypothetical protein